MSQQQQGQQRPRDEQRSHQEAIKYGDVFDVSGSLASKPIAPQDASTMQAAENLALGQTQKGGPEAVMQSAAAVNEKIGAVRHRDVSDIARDQGVTVREVDVGGTRVVSEEVGGQVVGRYVTPEVPLRSAAPALGRRDAVTIGEALEASALSAGDKTVDQSDAAAIQAAEVRATGTNEVTPGGVASMAQSAADVNPRIMLDQAKTRLSDVLSDASRWLVADKEVTREDAEGVISAEIRNKRDMSTTPGGVAAAITAAARLNQKNK
ncbi:late embryogenesis abundant protein D-34 [Corylus avellana]|uniref:late embryogenesis abundant protein D-34 n=1 Tax=Corylus avellana TaxID=13451 RepID=UPI001E236BE6|nr:late embryogenesis abundant protein D-34 [Corylus avellana]